MMPFARSATSERNWGLAPAGVGSIGFANVVSVSSALVEGKGGRRQQYAQTMDRAEAAPVSAWVAGDARSLSYRVSLTSFFNIQPGTPL